MLNVWTYPMKLHHARVWHLKTLTAPELIKPVTSTLLCAIKSPSNSADVIAAAKVSCVSVRPHQKFNETTQCKIVTGPGVDVTSTWVGVGQDCRETAPFIIECLPTHILIRFGSCVLNSRINKTVWYFNLDWLVFLASEEGDKVYEGVEKMQISAIN